MQVDVISTQKIGFTILYSGDEYRLDTYYGEYRDLKSLIVDRLFPEDFGQCGGMGRCATCMVEIKGLGADSAFLKRNEETTLERMGAGGPDIRLACQIELDDDLANTVIRIIENK